MKKMVKKLKIFLVIATIVMPAFVMAQEPPPFTDDPIDVPFDGGVSLLVAAGIGYGLKKVYDNKKAEKNYK